MSELTLDEKWNNDSSVKTLTLEHHMAAIRMGFKTFFNPLYQVDILKQGLLEGTLSSVNFFTKTILPIYNAHKTGNKFEISNIVKRDSPLFDKKYIIEEADKKAILNQANLSVASLFKLWESDRHPTLLELLLEVSESKLFIIPGELRLSIERTKSSGDEEEQKDDDENLLAWDQALLSDFNEVIKYNDYISDSSNFGTHQGVKGLEFDRVMVVIDDEESKGFMFSYDKFFGVKELSKSDNQNIAEGKETGIDRTARLFYVGCSRAKESLAIVAYTDNAEQLKTNLLELDWFSADEIEVST